MLAAGTRRWNLDAILARNLGEETLSIHDITIHSSLFKDYSFQPDRDIHDEVLKYERFGQLQNLVIEKNGSEYSLLGPFLPFLAARQLKVDQMKFTLRRGDDPVIQHLISIRLNASYSKLSPLVYSRHIDTLTNIFTVIKEKYMVSMGGRREWIAGQLNISPSAVSRYSSIQKMPVSIQLRCNEKQFPYTRLLPVKSLNQNAWNILEQLLFDYDMHHGNIVIPAGDLDQLVQMAKADADNTDGQSGHVSIALSDETLTDIPAADSSVMTEMTDWNFKVSTDASHKSANPDPALSGFISLMDSYEDDSNYTRWTQLFQTEMNRRSETASDPKDIFYVAAHNGFVISDSILRDAAFRLYVLSHMNFTQGQKALNQSCMKIILQSLYAIYKSG